MGNETKRRLATAAAFLVMATGASRVLGLVREMVMTYYLGLGAPMGAFTVAFRIPSLIRTLLADTALSASFIPVFSELLEKERRREAWQVAFSVTLLAVVCLGAISLLGMLFAPQIVRLMVPEDQWDAANVNLAIDLSRIMFPTVAVLGVAGILMGILNAYDHFSLPALAPIVWNLAIIGASALFAPRYGFYAVAWGVLVGTIVELAIQLPAVWKRRERGLFSLKLRHSAVKQVGLLLGPVVLSLGIVNFNALVNTVVASYVSEAAPAVIDKAFRLFQLPQGMFAVAIGTVLFPTLSRFAAAGKLDAFRSRMEEGTRQIFFVTLPFTAFFLVLAEPTVRLIYERGAVRPEDTAQVAYALAFYSLGMAFVSANTLLNRGFYGIQKPRLPLIMGVANLIVNLALNLALYKPLGVGGVTLSTSVVSLLNFFGLLVLLQTQVGRMDLRSLALSAGRSLLALAPLAAAAYFAWLGVDSLVGRSWPAQILSLSAGYGAGLAAYAATAWALRMDELRQIVRIVARRRRSPEMESA